MNEATYQLFVYGSLRSGFRNPAYLYLAKYFNLLGEGCVNGKLYDNGSFPVAVPSSGNSTITGELYALNNPEEFVWAMGQLDDYEGLNTEPGEKPLYKRDIVMVEHNGAFSPAWIYWYNGNVDTMTEIETGDIMKYIREKNKS
jgi:gamma-glutamylcyclotransferase (GGCT)/AIG2-like uncharacterized protein YtfP